jgi:hypothetical protein
MLTYFSIFLVFLSCNLLGWISLPVLFRGLISDQPFLGDSIPNTVEKGENKPVTAITLF